MKRFDIICLGRIAIDLYAHQVGAPLENVESFSKYLGGSSGNISFGCARQGLQVSMLARVGNDHFGRFIKNQLEEVGIDTKHIITDQERLTALAILGIKDKDTFPLIFYRKDCADMAIIPSDFSEEYIASSKSLLITGTHFSNPNTAKTCYKAIEYARKNSVKVILDIDYRPTLWGLTSIADGETRYIESKEVSSHLLSIFPLCDLIVGTEEEFLIGGGRDKLVDTMKEVRKATDATLVLKRGPLGNSVFDDTIPNDLDSAPIYSGVRVEVLNVLGAGDAFMSGFLRGWLNGEDHETCSSYANACGALVVSRHSCAPAIPTREELNYYLAHAHEISYPDQDTFLNHLHRVTTRKPPTDYWSDLNILAFDHRIQFEDLAKESGIPDNELRSRIVSLKKLIAQAMKQVWSSSQGKQIGVLVDGRYGQDILNELTGIGLWIARPVETPQSHPVTFEPSPDIGTEIISWPQEHIIKCLIKCHPDDPPHVWIAQEEKIRQLYDASIKTSNELLLEIIPIPSDNDNDSSILPSLIERIYQLGVKPDWWKLFPTTDTQWKQLSKQIAGYDPYCRGILLLGLNQDTDTLKKQFQLARQYPICKGFAIGRSIFQKQSREWLQGNITDDECIAGIKGHYQELMTIWEQCKTLK